MDGIRSIALLNPLGDFGINQYTWELAEALGAAGVDVTFYTSDAHSVPPPRHHTCLPVLQHPLYKRRAAAPDFAEIDVSRPPDWNEPPAASKHPAEPLPRASALKVFARRTVLTAELALHLRRGAFDVVWTQWPDLESYSPWFRPLCRSFGMRVVHTVHNVLPHEWGPDDYRLCGRVYRDSDLLFVHSESARRDLEDRFPPAAAKAVLARHGLYNLYPRVPDQRESLRCLLGIGPRDIAVLFAGAIRPYKNLDAAVESLALPGCERMVLIVAGKEGRYPDLVPGDPLGRTRKLAERYGVSRRVRLIPRHLSIAELSQIFEASDVQVLPYTSGSGSGMLLLGMSFGKYIVSSHVGGAAEYLRDYASHALLSGTAADAVAQGLRQAAEDLPSLANSPHRPPELEWSHIAREALRALTTRF